ncbi:MAG: histidine kinase [Micrococcales bacterium]|nr:histidine kinase [Micrococcales bacterium]
MPADQMTSTGRRGGVLVRALTAAAVPGPRWARLPPHGGAAWFGLVGVTLALGGLVVAVHAEARAFSGVPGPAPRLLLYALLTVAPLLLVARGPLHVWRLQMLGLVALGLTPAPAAWPWSVTGLLCLLLALVFTAVAEDTDRLVGVAVWTLLALIWSGRNTPAISLAALVFAMASVLVIGSMQRIKDRTQRELSTTRAALDAESTDHAILAERTRIARELHDSVGHRMTMIAIQAEATRLRHQDLPADTVSALEAIQATAREALAETRGVVSLLRSDSPTGPNADEAERAPAPGIDRLDDLVTQARRGGMVLDYHRTGPVRPLPAATELAAFRIVQESLANAARHAAGAAVDITLDFSDTALTVSVVNTRPPREPEPVPAAEGEQP